MLRSISISLSSLLLLGAAQAGQTIDLNSSGDNVTIYVEQSRDHNTVTGSGGTASLIGNYGFYHFEQGNMPYAFSGYNYLSVDSYGLNNHIESRQAHIGPDGGHHDTTISINGDNNTLDLSQKNGGDPGSGHWSDALINGDGNSIIMLQRNDGAKQNDLEIAGNGNSIAVNQKGSGQHTGTVYLSGDGHVAGLVQDGAGNHSANITAFNVGGAANIQVDQDGATDKTYSVTQHCANPLGCSVTVIQH